MIDFDTIKAKTIETAETAAAAAKRLAGSVKTGLDVCAEEERLKGVYQTIGKQRFAAWQSGTAVDPQAEANLFQQAAQCLRRIAELKERDQVSTGSSKEEYETVQD